jgi:F-type H+-transporting ATPase subunit b
MNAIIESFHLDLKLLIAQAVNFLIVFLVLYYFVFKPLAKIMKDREKKITKSLDDAKKIEERLSGAEEDYKKKMSEAKKEASAILEKASQDAEAKKKEMVAKAKDEIGQVINQEKAKMQSEKAKTLKEIKAEIADLVVATAEKVIGEKMNSKNDQEIIKNITKNIK